MLDSFRTGLARALVRSARYVVPGNFRNYYEAGKSGRRLGIWQPGSLGPNAAVLQQLDLLRARSRDAARNNGWIKKGINTWVSNEIGTGITPRSQAPDEKFRQAADALWLKWGKFADADGLLDINGLMWSASRNRIESGEIFIRFRPRNLSEGLPVPLQLQLLEPEFCPVNENQVLSGGSRKIRAGIEFDGIGRRRAYWMYRSHPGDRFMDSLALDLVPVPADSVIHHYAPLRPGQIRGVPWTVQALIKAKDFDEYDDAELLRKKNKSSYTGAVVKPNYDLDNDAKFDPISGEPLERDANDIPMITSQPGSLFSLLPGEDVRMFDGDSTGSGYADFVRQQLLGVAAALDVPYEFISGDMSKVNDRTLRAILSEFHRIIEQTQWMIFIPQVCDRVYEEFIDTAVMSGALTAPGYDQRREEYLAVEWHPTGWPYLHELQDAQADQIKLKSGLTSRKRIAAKQGEVIEEIDRENAEDKDRADSLGLNYDTQAPEPQAEDPADDPDEKEKKEAA